MAEVEVRGARLAFDDAGQGDPAFVFVHGFGCDRSVWRAQFADLSRDHRCLSVDLRGCGESGGVTADTMTAADDLAALLERVVAAPAIVVGHGSGGLVALLLNEQHPGKVLGVVLGDAPVGPSLESFRRLSEAVAGSSDVAAVAVEGLFSDETPEAVRTEVRDLMLVRRRNGAGESDAEAGEMEARMAELVRRADEKPFMAIWPARPGGDIAWLREHGRFLRHEPIAGAGHFFQFEQPEITNALLRAFLDDVERDPRLARAAG